MCSNKAVNIEQTLELFLVSLDENCTYQDFMNHFFSCNDVNYINGLINDISFIKENGERSSVENFEMLLEEYVMQMFCYSDCLLEDTCNQFILVIIIVYLLLEKIIWEKMLLIIYHLYW